MTRRVEDRCVSARLEQLKNAAVSIFNKELGNLVRFRDVHSAKVLFAITDKREGREIS
jgi:hypothetical protein